MILKAQKKVFFTYGTKQFSLQKKHLLNLAQKIDAFDLCIGFDFSDIDNEFKNKNMNLFKYKKGAGFWIWKLYFLKKLLTELSTNDILVYSDSGSSINTLGRNRLLEYFEIMNNSESGNLRFQLSHCLEKNWTNKELFSYLNLKPESQYGNTGQLISGHMMFKKNDTTLKIINEFENLIKTDHLLITDEYTNNSQVDGFMAHRHDQSILSLLSKIYGTEILKDETALNDPFSEEEIQVHPFRAVQVKKYTFYQKVKFYLNFNKNINRSLSFKRKEFWFQKDSILKIIYQKLKF